jgi:16S rRNA (uracil1498-N3)-methyltransferase
VNPALRSSAAHVFVDAVDDPLLADDDRHHLFRVLRLRDGEPVSVSDGRGRWRLCTAQDGALVSAGSVEFVDPPLVRCTIAVAIPKGDRVDWMVQKLTEVGAHHIVLLHCERSVVRWDGERGHKQLARLQRVAREASMQSRRIWLPEVTGPVALADVLGPNAVVADPAGAVWRTADTIVIGPEGGFSPGELEAATAAGSGLISLGDQVLRVETAAVVAAVRAITTT